MLLGKDSFLKLTNQGFNTFKTFYLKRDFVERTALRNLNTGLVLGSTRVSLILIALPLCCFRAINKVFGDWLIEWEQSI